MKKKIVIWSVICGVILVISLLLVWQLKYSMVVKNISYVRGLDVDVYYHNEYSSNNIINVKLDDRSWLADNIATIIVGTVVLVVIALVIVKMVRDKRQGKSSCSCGCAGCAMSATCHKRKDVELEDTQEKDVE